MPRTLTKFPVHLGLGATAEAEPEFTGTLAWYMAYGARHEERDGKEGRLVAMHTFNASWDSWEIHPEGAELIVCTEGQLELIQEVEGAEQNTRLLPGEYAIVPPGVWHTADIDEHATALFVTAGRGTQTRGR